MSLEKVAVPFSVDNFVMKIATCAMPENVSGNFIVTPND
jgi:hypothetical protein